MNGNIHGGNTNNFWLLGLTDEASVAADPTINDATVTWAIRTEAWSAAGVAQGTLVASGSGAAIGSGGNYRCDVDAAAALSYGTTYYREVKAVKAGVGQFLSHESFVAKRRTGKTPTT